MADEGPDFSCVWSIGVQLGGPNFCCVWSIGVQLGVHGTGGMEGGLDAG